MAPGLLGERVGWILSEDYKALTRINRSRCLVIHSSDLQRGLGAT